MSHLVRRLASACALLAVLLVPAAASAAVNLNTATFDELVAVTGIGPKKAQQIIDHRESKGPFKSVDDLKQIKGFRDKLVENLRPELTVSAPPARAVAKDASKKKEGAAAPAAVRADAGRIDEKRAR